MVLGLGLFSQNQLQVLAFARSYMLTRCFKSFLAVVVAYPVYLVAFSGSDSFIVTCAGSGSFVFAPGSVSLVAAIGSLVSKGKTCLSILCGFVNLLLLQLLLLLAADVQRELPRLLIADFSLQNGA